MTIDNVWTEAELEKLRALYPKAPWDLLLAELSSRSKASICQMACIHNVARHVNSRSAWTCSEEKLLRDMFPDSPWDSIALALPRHTKRAIFKHAHIMKLSRRGTKLQPRYELIRCLREARRQSKETQRDLAARIGVDKNRVGAWEVGAQVPRLPALLDWANALGFTLTLTENKDG